jgi:hypothetical protein
VRIRTTTLDVVAVVMVSGSVPLPLARAQPRPYNHMHTAQTDRLGSLQRSCTHAHARMRSLQRLPTVCCCPASEASGVA